jgi:ABC-type phosphate transport system substrate-binding protein
VADLYLGVIESFPEAQWNVENAKMVTVDRTRSDGTRETLRAVVGHTFLEGAFNVCPPEWFGHVTLLLQG